MRRGLGRFLLALALHHFDAGVELFIRHVQPELNAEYGPELCFVFPVMSIGVACRVTHGPAPRLLNMVMCVRFWARHDEFAQLRRIQMGPT